MVANLVADPIAIGVAARAAVFFVGPEDDAQGAPGTEPKLVDQVRGFQRGDDAGAIVLRAGADIPGIDVAADDDNFFRLLAADDFADDVRRIGIGESAGFHFEVNGDGVGRVGQSLDESGVFDGDGGGGDFGIRFGILERAGVRRLQADGSDRANEHGDRSETGGARGTGVAIDDGASVALIRRVVENDFSLDGGAAFALELVEVGDGDDFGGDSFFGSSDAAAESEDGERLDDWLDERGAFVAADPMRDFDVRRD